MRIDVTINPEAAGETIINTISVNGVNVADIPAGQLPVVCPDGSAPVNNVCENKPVDPDAEEDGPPIIYLPIIYKQ